MPAQPLQTEAFVLVRRPAADSYHAFSLFSPEHGAMLALQRTPKRPKPGHVALDLFDEASLHLESSNQGRTWFVREARVLSRHGGIGRSYEALEAASAFAALIARNPVEAESRPNVAVLLRTVFSALATADSPAVVHFKSLYRFAREEGYPVKQQWLPSLPPELRARAETILHTPLAEFDARAVPKPECAAITRRLEAYLREYTEILLD
jgi:hypothetical protein